jgi:hypothetical protein
MDQPRLRQFASRIGFDLGVEADPPPWLRDAVETVLPDLQDPWPSTLPVSYRQREDGMWWVQFGATSFTVPDATDGAALLVEIAFRLQEQVFDTFVWGEAQPKCRPGHVHPPDPRVSDGKAVWVCPREDRVLARVGQLHKQRRRSR